MKTQTMKVDTTNEDPTYWENLLAESNLAVVEEPEPIPIDEEQLLSLNAEAQDAQEEQQSDFDPIIPLTKTRMDNWDDWSNEELTKLFDSHDSFMTGHSVLKERRGTHECPEWATNDQSCRELLLSVFPKLRTDLKQRTSAARWAAVISLFFRQEKTEGQVAETLKLHVKNVEMIVLNIKRAAAGKNAHGGDRKKPGRPRKSVQ